MKKILFSFLLLTTAMFMVGAAPACDTSDYDSCMIGCEIGNSMAETMCIDWNVSYPSLDACLADMIVDCDYTCEDLLPDCEPPVITLTELPSWPNCAIYPAISAEITDESGIEFGSVVLRYKYNGYPWNFVSFMNPPVNDIYSLNVNWFVPQDNNNFKYYIEALDTVGNPATSGSTDDYEEFTYDCANPVAGVTGESSSWVASDSAEVTCTDSASGCDVSSYRLYVSASSISECPETAYVLSDPQTISEESWVCSYAEDNAGNSDYSDPVHFLVDGVDPIADANGPYSCNEGETISLDGSGSTDDNEVSDYDWDLDNDGDYDDASGMIVSYYCADGNDVMSVSLRVTDHVGNFDEDDSTVNVANINPWNVDAGSLYSGNEGDFVSLSGSADDVPADSLTYAWDLDNDGVYETSGQNVDFECLDDSDNTVWMKATDDDGGFDIDSAVVTCLNVAPWEVYVYKHEDGYEGSSIALTGDALDVPADTLTFAWDLDNDGVYEMPGQDVSFSCVDDLVDFPVYMMVSDEDGGVSYADSAVTCLNVAPVVDAGADQVVNEGETVTIAPTFDDVGILDTHTVEVDWGYGFEDSLTHVYCDGEEHTVTVRVTDDDGGIGMDTLIVTVNNVAPTIDSVGGPYVGVIGEILTFSVEASDVCGNQRFDVTWDFSPNGTQNDWNEAYWNARFDGNVVVTVSDGTDSVSADVPVTIYDYKIELDKGWNLISIPLVPEEDDTDLSNVFASVAENVEVVWAYTWDAVKEKNVWTHHEVTAGSFDSDADLLKIVPGYGYYVKMAEDDEMYLNGKNSYRIGFEDEESSPVMGMPPSVTLATNSWNLIGKYGQGDMSYPEALVSLTSENNLFDIFGMYYDILYDKNGNFPWFLGGTEGYWLSIKLIPEASTIEYKANYNNEECNQGCNF